MRLGIGHDKLDNKPQIDQILINGSLSNEPQALKTNRKQQISTNKQS